MEFDRINSFEFDFGLVYMNYEEESIRLFSDEDSKILVA